MLAATPWSDASCRLSQRCMAIFWTRMTSETKGLDSGAVSNRWASCLCRISILLELFKCRDMQGFHKNGNAKNNESYQPMLQSCRTMVLFLGILQRGMQDIPQKINKWR